MKVRRFFYVTSETSDTMHMLFGRRVEGERTACGIAVSTTWHWAKGRSRFGKRRCANCMRAGAKL